jgi:hypothetical protein
MTPEQHRAVAAVAMAWREGRLRYKLKEHQRRAYDRTWIQFHAQRRRRFAWRWSRRLGKTFASHLMIVEACARIPNSRYVIAAPSEKHLKKFSFPTIDTICADAPPEFQPRFDRAASEYRFPNGSVISLHGCDNDAKISRMGRGPAAHGLLFEEAGEIPNLEKAVKVTAPQLLSTRKLPGCGWVLFVGTPPEGTSHYFVTICNNYRLDERESHYTVFDGHYSAQELEEFLEEDADGMPLDEYRASEAYRREWLGELIGDPSRMVLKFATEANMRACVERYRALLGADGKPRRPSHFVVYESLDVGWEDWTFGLLGWWHYPLQTLVIELELVYRGGFKREVLAKDFVDAEVALLGPARRSPYQDIHTQPRRWSDYAPELLAELSAEYDLPFNATAKEDRDTAINQCDRMLPGYGSAGKLAINPECKELLTQMPAAIWNKARTEFARNATKRHGHYDGVASLVYMSRNVVRTENPVPAGWGMGGPGRFYEPAEPPATEESKWATVFGVTPEEEA